MTRPRSVADWLQWQESLNPRPVHLGLDRVREVLDRLDVSPPVGRVVTVGGTNGKGSTITLLHDVLRAAGCNPGLYTSPHLVRYNERIRVGDRPIGDAPLIAAFERVEAARADVPLTYFEFGTLAGLVSFVDAGCDTWLLEVGLGGRLDAVNALDADIAVITTIGLDHQEWLGDTIESIAGEKAGIFRPGAPALYGDSPLPDVIRSRAAEIGADLLVHGQDFHFEQDAVAGWSWTGNRGRHVVNGLKAPAHWTHAQFRNATVALEALSLLRPAVGLTARFLNPVLLQSSPPGRFQIVRREHEWILDVAHNPQAAVVLRDQLATLPEPPGGRGSVTVVLALLADKAIAGFVGELRSVAGRWVVAGVADPRASTRSQMRDALAAAGVPAFTWAETTDAAFELARQQTPTGGRIVVCGSFRIVAPALEWLGLY